MAHKAESNDLADVSKDSAPPPTCPLCSDVTVLLRFTSVGGCGVLPGGEDAPPAAALRPHQARSGVQGLPFCGSNSLL